MTNNTPVDQQVEEDPYRTNPPQTLPFHPHDRMQYAGVHDGIEYVICMEPTCRKPVPWPYAAEHQHTHTV